MILVINRKFLFNWTINFLIIALIAGLIGFTGLAGALMGIARIVFVIALILWITSYLTVAFIEIKKK